MDNAPAIKKVTQSTADEAARVLAAAFSTDPIFLWMSGRASVSSAQLIPAFRAMIGSELRSDEPEIFIAADGGCVTMWHGIDKWKTSAVEGLRTTPGFLRSFGLSRVPTLLKTQSALERAHPSAPHYHLGFIGTEPSKQGTGLGSTTLTPMLDRCDTEGVAAYLESSNPTNEAFYVRHGFVVTEPITLPDGAPPIIGMWRDPRG